MSGNENDHDEPRPDGEPPSERRKFLKRLGALGLGHFAFSMLGGAARAQSDGDLFCGDPLPDGTAFYDTNCGKTGPSGVEMDYSCGMAGGTNPEWVYNDLDCNGAYVTEGGTTQFRSDEDCAGARPEGTIWSDEGCLRSNPARPGSVWGDSDCGKVAYEGVLHADNDCGWLKSPVGRHTDEDCGVPMGGSDDRCNKPTDFGGLYEDGDCGKPNGGGTHVDNNCSSSPLGNYVDSDCGITGSDSNPPGSDG